MQQGCNWGQVAFTLLTNTAPILRWKLTNRAPLLGWGQSLEDCG